MPLSAWSGRELFNFMLRMGGDIIQFAIALLLIGPALARSDKVILLEYLSERIMQADAEADAAGKEAPVAEKN